MTMITLATQKAEFAQIMRGQTVVKIRRGTEFQTKVEIFKLLKRSYS